MTNESVVNINSLKVTKIEKILLYEMKVLVPNYSCLQNLWLGGYRPQIPLLSVLCPQRNLLNPPPPKKKKFLRTPLEPRHFILPATSDVASDRTGFVTVPSCISKYTFPFFLLGYHRRLRLVRIISHGHQNLQRLHFACHKTRCWEGNSALSVALHIYTARKATVWRCAISAVNAISSS